MHQEVTWLMLIVLSVVAAGGLMILCGVALVIAGLVKQKKALWIAGLALAAVGLVLSAAAAVLIA